MQAIRLTSFIKGYCFRPVSQLQQIVRYNQTNASPGHVQRKPKGRVLDGAIDINSDVYAKRIEHSKQLETKYGQIVDVVMKGGGEKAIERHIKRNKKMLVRDRMRLLIDNNGKDFLELSPLAGMGLEYGDIPATGTITGIGWVHGVPCMIIAHDATVKGGTMYPISVKKSLRAQEIATMNRLPCINIVDSGGAFLPLQADIFPDKNHGGRGFYNQAIMSSMKIPQISIVCGSCTAGGAYTPTMSDEVVILKGIGTIFLGGPPLVYAAIGEMVSPEELGGADLHCRVSGYTDHYAESEEEAFAIGRDIVSTLNAPSIYDLAKREYQEPLYPAENLAAFATIGPNEDIDMYKLLAHIIDGSYLYEFKTLYGPTLITGFAHISGHLVGIIANQGPMSGDAALKGAHFIELCCQRDIPIIFLQNTTSEDVADYSKKSIKQKANIVTCKSRLIAAISAAEVPKLTVIVGSSLHPENLLMCGRSFDPRFLWVWPNATIGVEDDCRDSFYSSGRNWDDGIILPKHTRKVLSQGLSIVKHFATGTSTNFGVFRM
ncbi:methylcrotonoyl-CoA carboxylase beta chain, mitochondrial-like [Glandiceps talaboti]